MFSFFLFSGSCFYPKLSWLPCSKGSHWFWIDLTNLSYIHNHHEASAIVIATHITAIWKYNEIIAIFFPKRMTLTCYISLKHWHLSNCWKERRHRFYVNFTIKKQLILSKLPPVLSNLFQKLSFFYYLRIDDIISLIIHSSFYYFGLKDESSLD